MKEKRETPRSKEPIPVDAGGVRDDEVIRIADLAPSGSVKGGRKILLGEMLTPASGSRIQPGS